MATNAELHKLFHELSGAINGISLMSQVCVMYIKEFKLEKLEGKFKKVISSNFRNIQFYYRTTIERLASVVEALAKIDAADVGTSVKDIVNGKLKRAKQIIDNSEVLYNTLLHADTKENLLCFAKELEKLKPICHFMGEAINSFKKKLIARGKY